jgi:hypothetical protein
MFQEDANPRTRLRLVRRPQEPQGQIKGELKMNSYKVAEYNSSSSVANGVTFLVSVWFLVAAGAIIADTPSPYTQRGPAQVAAVETPVETPDAAPSIAIAPEARFTITVEASRSANL